MTIILIPSVLESRNNELIYHNMLTKSVCSKFRTESFVKPLVLTFVPQQKFYFAAIRLLGLISGRIINLMRFFGRKKARIVWN